MKRIALFILSLALAAPAFAQEEDSRDIYTNGIFAFNIADHVGWGYNIVTTDAFTPAYCGEYFINVLALKVRPVQGLTLKLGVDCKWDDLGRFRLQERLFLPRRRQDRPGYESA